MDKYYVTWQEKSENSSPTTRSTCVNATSASDAKNKIKQRYAGRNNVKAINFCATKK